MTFQHWASVAPYTSSSELAESWVFDKQSSEPLLCDLPPCGGEAPLIANLRGQFAEFLPQSSHARLRIFSSPTCVGLGYGHFWLELRGFSCQDIQSVRFGRSRAVSSIARYADAFNTRPEQHPTDHPTDLRLYSLGLPIAPKEAHEC